MTTNLWRRILGLSLPAAVLLAALALPASAGGSGHPYFDDQGTLTWYHSLAEARAAAERENKLIFIEYGRRVCSNCNVLCSRVLPDPLVSARMGELAVGLVAECDSPENEVYWLFKRNLPNARMLPFAAFVTPKGRWVTGFAGRPSVPIFETHVALAESIQRRIARRRSAEPRAPVAEREPTSEPAPARTPAAPPARVRKPAPAPVRAPTVRTPAARAPAPAEPEEPVEPADLLGSPDGAGPDDEFCSPEDCCPGGKCYAPSLCLPGLPRIALPGLGNPCKPPCAPCPAPEPGNVAPGAVIAEGGGFCDFPPPAPRRSQEGRLLAGAVPALPPPVGSPDGDEAEPVPAPSLPAPVVRAPTPVPPAPSPRIHVSRTALAAAVDRGDWATVVRGTRGATRGDEEMLHWNRQAHAWAHGQLASAVRALQERRFGEARQAVGAVTVAMRGEAEAVDAERGAEALELIQDIDHLSEDSPVRRAVRKNAYEKMRGTRWAPLFSDCPAPSRALSVR